ncbi:hypothetical protein [Mesoterricola sediminis]|uniref:hypothetical protein n=1 Tax=Mesoterricola sediminis TaxID=2927980 RepID=UPI001FAF207D|nr:hypothetical protein [Mesoterricola sediminis]
MEPRIQGIVQALRAASVPYQAACEALEAEGATLQEARSLIRERLAGLGSPGPEGAGPEA